MKTDYNQNYTTYFRGQHKSTEYKKIKPCATVPSATDGDLTITESNAILQYAADVSGAEAMYPKDLKKRALVNNWLLWEACQWFPCCYIYLVEYVVKPLLQAEPDQKVIDGESERVNMLAETLNDQLSKTKWLTGDDVTITDFAVAAPMHLHEALRFPLESWKKTQGAVDKALLPKDLPKGQSNGQSESGQPAVRITVNHTQAADQLTELYFYETEKAKGIHEPGDSTVEISVSDGWPRAYDFTLDKTGFALHNFKRNPSLL
ncbi:hypothetical protein E8E11_010815 [Didymella keratinophila]|nr:hypothetical protein E8E11_010815 [Didymella keratinophila]